MNIENITHNLRVGIPEILEEISGGNSSVFKGRLSGGTLLAIKKYKGNQLRIERMLSREEKAINFLRARGIRNVPEILEVRRDLGLIVYRWIEGEAPKSDYESMNAIIGMCESLYEINTQGFSFDNAVDAAFSLSEIETQVLIRIQEFESSYASLSVRQLCEKLKDRLNLCRRGIDRNEEFTLSIMSISDLGTHNILRSREDYKFIDFEFFGRDSVNKLVGDFLLHPRNEFKEAETSRFISAISQMSDWNSAELIEVLPLLTLKWAVIAFGRTFRESDLGMTGGITEELISDSIGSLYLRYFDSLELALDKDSLSTFRSFAGKIAEP